MKTIKDDIPLIDTLDAIFGKGNVFVIDGEAKITDAGLMHAFVEAFDMGRKHRKYASGWPKFWAQVSLQFIRYYCGRDEIPDWWNADIDQQVEAWLLGVEYKKQRVEE